MVKWRIGHLCETWREYDHRIGLGTTGKHFLGASLFGLREFVYLQAKRQVEHRSSTCAPLGPISC